MVSTLMRAGMALGVAFSLLGSCASSARSDGLHVYDLATHPGSPTLLYLATSEGLFRTRDGGTSWLRLTRGLPENAVFFNVVAIPGDPGTVYTLAGTTDRDQIYRSTDAGEHWHRFERGIMYGLQGRVVRFYVGLNPYPRVYVTKSGAMGVAGIYYASATRWEGVWRMTGTPPVFSASSPIVIDPQNSNRILLVGNWHEEGQSTFALIESPDRGATWSKVAGVPHDFFFAVSPSFASDRKHSSRMYFSLTQAGAHDQWWGTLDGGRTWNRLASFEHRSIVDLFLMPLRTNICLAVSQEGLTYRSKDRGRHWSRVQEDPHGEWYVGSLADENVVYTNPGGSRLSRSSDRGRTWEEMLLPHPNTTQ